MVMKNNVLVLLEINVERNDEGSQVCAQLSKLDKSIEHQLFS